jgi:hypothetical protein
MSEATCEYFHLQNKSIPDMLFAAFVTKVFKYQSYLETNLKSNSKGKVECVECGKQYASDRIVNEHVATKHE